MKSYEKGREASDYENMEVALRQHWTLIEKGIVYIKHRVSVGNNSLQGWAKKKDPFTKIVVTFFN